MRIRSHFTENKHARRGSGGNGVSIGSVGEKSFFFQTPIQWSRAIAVSFVRAVCVIKRAGKWQASLKVPFRQAKALRNADR